MLISLLGRQAAVILQREREGLKGSQDLLGTPILQNHCTVFFFSIETELIGKKLRIFCYFFRCGSRISARGGRQGNDDLIWDGNERFLTYANTDLQLFKMFIAILCLNGVEQPFKRHQWDQRI